MLRYIIFMLVPTFWLNGMDVSGVATNLIAGSNVAASSVFVLSQIGKALSTYFSLRCV